MRPKSKITLTDAQKYDLCVYARDHKLRSRSEYVDWIEQNGMSELMNQRLHIFFKQKTDAFLRK